MRPPRFVTRQRSLFNFVRREFFGSPLQIVLSLIAVATAIGGFVAITDLFVRIDEKFSSQPQIATYLAATYGVTMLLFVGWVLVYRKIQIILARERLERGQIARIQHRMAEIVRSAAINCGEGGLEELQKLTGIVELLSGELPRYLESKFGRKDISVTVKYAARSADSGGMKLKALFRRSTQNAHNRKQLMNLEDSVVFAKFASAGRSLQRIIICDTKDLSTDAAVVGTEDKRRNERYRTYAKDCGFRSVIAFPLRAPKGDSGPDPLLVNLFRGFISFDCPDPHAFEPLFQVPMFASKDNDGSHYRDTEDIDFFFGLADSLATLAMLFEDSSVRINGQEREAEAIPDATA